MTPTISASAALASFVVAALLSLGLPPASAQEGTASADPPVILPVGSRGLSIQQLLGLISTETGAEFGYDNTDPTMAETANNIWGDANAFEWKKASLAETVDGEPYPYLLCHVGEGMTGHQRRMDLKRALGAEEAPEGAEAGNGVIFDADGAGGDAQAATNSTAEAAQSGDKVYLRPLYNEEDFLCVFGRVLASRAAAITGPDFVVQPLVPSLKFMSGSVDGMKEDVVHSGKNMEMYEANPNAWDPSLDVVLCPGVALAQNEEQIQTWEDVPEDVAAEIVAQLLPKTKASELAEGIADTLELLDGAYEGVDLSETYYLTSEAYINATSSPTEGTVGAAQTERSKLWKYLLEDYQESGKCDEMYRDRLRWTIRRTADPEFDSSLLNVEFNTTGDTEFDEGCFLTLSLAVAAHPKVCSVESRERVETANVVLSAITQSELEGVRSFFDVGLDGRGQVVAVSDTGVDRDNCYFADPDDGSDSDTVNLDARKIAQYVDFVDRTDYQYGHGTHVAGTIAGSRADGPGMADGVAPGALLAFADIGDSFGQLSLPMDAMLLDTGRPHAKIHSMSWGSDINFYTTQARTIDQYMYDHDEFLAVIAAGNSGHDDTSHTVGSPATAKNVIAVGAHHNTGPSRPKGGLGPSYIADFSSRGPTADNRMKPDLMAPGKAVLSAGALPDIVGECDPSNGKIPGPKDKVDGLMSLQGTSMAAPAVAGTAAILREYFEQGWYPTGVKNNRDIVENPSGALIKAVLMNGAQWLNGVDNGVNGVTEIHPYDNNQGFGRIALQHSVYIPGKTEMQLTAWDRQEVFDTESKSYAVRIDKSNGCQYPNLSVTLVWVEPGKTYYPNGLGQPDHINSAERVIITGVNNGDEAIITVTASNLIRSSQKYSLVATGCFGGVANLNFEVACSVFVCDESHSHRIRNILLGIFIPLGVIMLCGGVAFLRRRKERGAAGGGYAEEDVERP